MSPECSVKHVQTKKIRKENTRSYLVQKPRGTFAGSVTLTFHLLAMWLSRGRGRSDREANDAASILASAKHRYFTGDSSSRDTRHTDPSARRNARNAERIRTSPITPLRMQALKNLLSASKSSTHHSMSRPAYLYKITPHSSVDSRYVPSLIGPDVVSVSRLTL